ncbi:hypothetical protein GUJ93_ZPchr0010g7968 [Zizania palustris]|uniref:Uncharacterized protein n=1 Tax=Zizania palustris TaxID=103762 RepID=A0A8J6BH58_ZIZPA|nr:hypothetical protein GUJ93_ZPchr0010g7968 [Zizania palustris]
MKQKQGGGELHKLLRSTFKCRAERGNLSRRRRGRLGGGLAKPLGVRVIVHVDNEQVIPSSSRRRGGEQRGDDGSSVNSESNELNGELVLLTAFPFAAIASTLFFQKQIVAHTDWKEIRGKLGLAKWRRRRAHCRL